TRVLNSDYFGESKKGGLRMWNALTYERGGLSLHAGCKVIPTNRGEQAMLIVGLSGTGKTTTTFTRQNNSQPVQDDVVALYPVAHPAPQREHHSRRRPARSHPGGGVLHARRDPGDERRRQGGSRQVPARSRHQSLLPAAPRASGQPLPRSPRRVRLRGVPAQH